eukprot:jgi/Botrbrau1/4679/Bobra.0218s0001.1
MMSHICMFNCQTLLWCTPYKRCTFIIDFYSYKTCSWPMAYAICMAYTFILNLKSMRCPFGLCNIGPSVTHMESSD